MSPHRTNFCAFCAAVSDVPADLPDGEYDRLIDLIFDRGDRVKRLHIAYGRKHRRARC